MDADGNMTGKEIIEWIDPEDYLHLSPSYVKAMLEYVHGLEAQLKEAEDVRKVLQNSLPVIIACVVTDTPDLLRASEHLFVVNEALEAYRSHYPGGE